MLLSRLPMDFDEGYDNGEAVYDITVDDFVFHCNLIRKHHNEDFILRKVQSLVEKEWLEKYERAHFNLKLYFNRK